MMQEGEGKEREKKAWEESEGGRERKVMKGPVFIYKLSLE